MPQPRPVPDGRTDVVATFARHSSEVNLVEGNKGLYDGLSLDGSNSNAALAKLLDLPVFLVIDARGMTRGIAPLILGYQAFDKDIHIAGVILNQLGGSRHESKLREVIEHYTDVPVVGAIQYDERLSIIERHLGLMPSNESIAASAKVKQIGDAIAEQVDLDKLLTLSQKEQAPGSGQGLRLSTKRWRQEGAHRHRARSRLRVLLR